MKAKIRALACGIILGIWTTGCWFTGSDTYDTKEFTAVHQAALDGSNAVLRLDLQTNPRLIYVPDYDKSTLLHLAVMHNHLDTVSLLLDFKADVNARNSAGMTPLHLAAKVGYLDIAKVLLDHKPKLNIKDSRGWTPLKWAEMSDHAAVATILRQNGGVD
jgi:ankyrin repeat protein